MAEKEIENLDKAEEEQSSPLTEDEIKDFVDEYAYQQALIDLVNEGEETPPEEQDDSKIKMKIKESPILAKNFAAKSLEELEREETAQKIELTAKKFNNIPKEKLRLFNNPYCYLTLNQLTRDFLFKSFRTLDFCILYNLHGNIVDNFYDIPNTEKFAFLIDYATSIRNEDKLIQFIKNFEKRKADKQVKVTQIIDEFPGRKIQEFKLSYFKIRDEVLEKSQIFPNEEEDDEDKKLKKLRDMRA